MQHIEKTEAIVLRVIPFSETSQVVTWLTPGRGRIATMIKGARRTKSPFLGQYDTFYTCELVYYVREHTAMHIARECCPLATRDALRTNWRATALASYTADLVSRASLEGGHQEELYALFESMLDFLSAEDALPPRPALIFWFELHLLNALGFAPHLDTCALCGGRVEAGRAAHYAFRRNGVICHRCPASEPNSELLLRPDTLAILRAWSEDPEPLAARNTVCSREQLFAMRTLFDTLLDQSAGVLTVNRPLAEEALAA